MMLNDSGLRAFGGSPLIGSAPLRYAHLDEAGTSRDEAHCLVAGVVSHPDTQWRQLADHLNDIMAEYVRSPQDRRGLVFHAKDIFHGTKRFHRNDWPLDKRQSLLTDICRIPAIFDLPVVFGPVLKNQMSWGDVKVGSARLEASNYGLAFGLCALSVEYVLKTKCDKNEIAHLIVEDVPNMRQYATSGYQILSDPSHDWSHSPESLPHVPLRRIVEHPQFAPKSGSALLQIADAMAFVLGRRINGRSDVDRFAIGFFENLVVLPTGRK
jgi:hypothetical protein